MPKPASADIRCSTVDTLAPSFSREDDRRVSPTLRASAGMATDCGKSTRWNTMPASGGPGRSVKSTRAPVCKPTPVVLTWDFSVRCLSMAGSGLPGASPVEWAIHLSVQGVSI